VKFKKEIGNESVRDLIREARARVAELPPENLYEPWPSYRSLEVEAVEMKTDSTEQDK
jgi:hypothetical protein